MKMYTVSWNIFFSRRYRFILLFLVIITGSLLGALCACDVGSYMTPLMRRSAASSVSIVRRSYALLLPYFAVVLAALYSKASWFIPICFLKSFCFAYCWASIILSFGEAFWLIGFFMLFSEGISFLLLVKLALRYIQGFQDTACHDILMSAVVTVGFGLLDCLYVAPFLVWITNG